MKIIDTPFSLVVFAPLLADPQPEQQHSDVPLQITTADQGLALLVPTLYIPLPRSLSPECGIQLAFRKIDDFTPESIVARTPWLSTLAAGSEQERKRGDAPAQSSPLDAIMEMVALPGGQLIPVKRIPSG